jgi:heme oxygenase
VLARWFSKPAREPRHHSAADWTLAPRSRAAHLEMDLIALAVSCPADAPAARLPAMECEAHAVGCLYVIEGSALGGQVVSRHIARSLGIDAHNGGRYFSGDGRATGDRWRQVCAALESYDTAEGSVIIDGARRTFCSLTDWLNEA